MSKQPRVATDPELLKPIIEAVIFASEEPLSPRTLIRLLAGEKESEPSMPLDFAAEGEERGEDGGSRVEDGGSRMEDGEERGEDRGSRIEDGGAGEDAADEEGVGEGAPVGEAEVSEAVVIGGMAGEDEGGGEDAGDRLEEDASEEDDPEEIPTATGDDADEATAMEGSGDDLADAMDRVEGRISARQFRPSDGTIDQAYLRALIDELNDEYLQSGRAFRIVEVAGGFQFATIREYGEFVAMLSKDKARRKLSPAALETLAIIAYRQPVSKPEVEAIRGVNCDQVLLNLMEKNLIAITGRSEAVGRPLLYGTTEDFLRSFGLKGLGDLPKLREIEELMEEDAYSAERAEVITVDENADVAELEAQIGAAGHAAEEERMEDGGGEDRGGEDGGEEDGGGEDRGEEDGGEEDGGEEPSEEGESDAGESDAGESDAGESGAEAGDEGGLGDDGVSDGAAMSDDDPMIAVEEEDETFAGDVAVDADAVAGHDGEDDVMAREMDASGDVADGDPPADAADASSASPSDAPEEPVGDAEHAVDEEG